MQLPNLFLQSAKKYGIDTQLVPNLGASHLYVESNKVLSLQKIQGLDIKFENLSQGVKIKLVIKKGVKIKKPIALCFGVLEEKKEQVILPEIILEPGAEATILAHGTFPQAKKVLHKMTAKINLKERSKLTYTEVHYHGENFGVEMKADFKFLIGAGASLENNFILKQGSVGKLKINLQAELAKDASTKIFSQIIGKGKKDDILINDKILLNGSHSRSLMKLKAVALNGGKMFFKGETEAGIKAKGASGHIDCQEIVVGENSVAQSIPVVLVKNPEARITHEASVGKVNQKELETLMSRGLSEEEAIDFIIRGKLK